MVKETCATVFGCEVEDNATETETMSACTKPPAGRAHEASAEATAPPIVRARAPQSPDTCDEVGDTVIFPANPADVSKIRAYLRTVYHANGRSYLDESVEVTSKWTAFTAFFYVHAFTKAYVNTLNTNKALYGVSLEIFLSLLAWWLFFCQPQEWCRQHSI